MLSEYRYSGRSGLTENAGASRLAMATNQLGEAAYFRAELREPLVMREGLAALWEVVTNDLKWRPRARVAYRAWLDEQDRAFAASFSALNNKLRVAEVLARMRELDASRALRRRSFDAARQRYLLWAAKDELEAYRVLDPVITVHPDQLSFEAFSRDQSSYARLAVGHHVFGTIEALECGTTNVDYSAKLHDHLDRLRSYRKTRFDIGAGGFASERIQPTLHDAVAYEKRIDLPDGWLSGFLQVHGLMSMALTRVRLAPIDVVNVLRFLQTHKAKVSPRSLRVELRPGQPVRFVLEPWDVSLWCSPASTYQGPEIRTIKLWGRDRLKTLARVLPVSEHIDLYLAGTGLPSVWVCALRGGLSYTLALSGWTDNDWVAGPAQFDLLTRRATVTASELALIYQQLRSVKHAPYPALSEATQLSLEKVRSGVSVLCQAGRAMFDLATGEPRHRDLLLEPFVASSALKLAQVQTEMEPNAKLAAQLHAADALRIIARRPLLDGGYKLSGNCADGELARVRPQLHLSANDEIVEASCTCTFMTRNGLTKGPCEHVLALRLAHQKLQA